MRSLEGYVCWMTLGTKPHQLDLLFGQSVSNKGKLYENLTTNGQVPFIDRQSAKLALNELNNRGDFNKDDPKLAYIKMLIAHGSEEARELEQRSGRFVILMLSYNPSFIGRFVEGKRAHYPLPGAPLETNGMQPFTNFAHALDVAIEIQRQCGCPVEIARFNLRKK